MKKSLLLSLCLMAAVSLSGQQLDSLGSFDASAANQAVAADADYLYAIDNVTIEKYDKSTGEKLKTWKDTTGAWKHLNSGVVLGNELYCAHSNFPEVPMASSIEVFDTKELKPIRSHSFGIDIGSATWIDRYDDHWYVAFAHYSGARQELDKDNSWTQLVKFTDDWQRVGGWIFPRELLALFGNMSNSGGYINDEGVIYATGHDNKELYQLEFPTMGYTLKWVKTLPAPFEGQGIAEDPQDQELVYGISRSQKKIIKARFSTLDAEPEL